MSLVLINAPADLAVTLDELKDFLELDLDDTTRDSKLEILLAAACEDCERWTRLKLVTQTWLLRADGFPGVSVVYDRNGYPCLQLPFPPFQSIEFVKYIDTAGVVQTMPRDVSYGTDSSNPFYCYQLEPGGGIKPARVAPMWARPYPPARLVLANTMVQFRCGFGGPLSGMAITSGSKLLTVSGFKFNADDAPQIEGDKGTAITITGAGASGADLVTRVASVDSSGVATLADAAGTTVSAGTGWLGNDIPAALKQSILFHAQFFYEQGAVVDQAVPRVVEVLRNSFRNLVS
jgi:hypothetical protein